MIEWRIIANKTRKCGQKNTKILWQPISFWNKATSKKWESNVAKMVKIVLCRQ